MADITPVVTPIRDPRDDHLEGFQMFWETCTSANATGTAVEEFQWSDRSVQITGTFGTSGNLQIQGSNDGTNYVVLTDPQGNDLDITAAGIKQISEVTKYVRPVVTAGDGTTDLDVTLMAARKYR